MQPGMARECSREARTRRSWAVGAFLATRAPLQRVLTPRPLRPLCWLPSSPLEKPNPGLLSSAFEPSSSHCTHHGCAVPCAHFYSEFFPPLPQILLPFLPYGSHKGIGRTAGVSCSLFFPFSGQCFEAFRHLEGCSLGDIAVSPQATLCHHGEEIRSQKAAQSP